MGKTPKENMVECSFSRYLFDYCFNLAFILYGGNRMKRPFVRENAYDLADMVAKEFAKHNPDKKTIREIQSELYFRTNAVAKIIAQIIETYFKSLPK